MPFDCVFHLSYFLRSLFARSDVKRAFKSAESACFRGFEAVNEPSILRLRGLKVNRFEANIPCLVRGLILAKPC